MPPPLCWTTATVETVAASQNVRAKKTKKTDRVDAEDPALGLDVGQRELDLAVDPAGPDKRWVERFDFVRRHDHLVSATIYGSRKHPARNKVKTKED